jgi:hypothetical protein
LVSLQRTLLLLIVTALLAGIVPAGVVIDRRLAREVEARAHDDLAQAPRLLADRNLALAEAMLMHAKEVARASRRPRAAASETRRWWPARPASAGPGRRRGPPSWPPPGAARCPCRSCRTTARCTR